MKRGLIIILLLFAINLLVKGKTGIVALAGITVILGFNIAKNFFDYLKTLQGMFTVGALIDFRKFPFGEIDNSNYELTFEFQNPIDKTSHKKIFFVFLLKKPDKGQGYKIWINGKNIDKSILLLKFNRGWLLLMIIGVLIWIAFLVFLIHGISEL